MMAHLENHVSIHAATTDGLTRIDDNCVIILNKAYVAHDCIIEDGATLSCGVKIGGNVHIMRDSNLGMGAVSTSVSSNRFLVYDWDGLYYT